MRKVITFTSMPVTSEAAFQSVLSAFQEQTGISVRLQIVPWEQERTEIVNMALRREEGDVLLVGTPITSDLIGMNALRPFTAGELALLGGAGAYLPARWRSGIRPGSSQVWAVPWLVDLRVLYYWRDLLEQSGCRETLAFQDHAQFRKTLAALQATGVEAPWAVSSERYHVLHAVSSWIWARGGDLFGSDGRSITFHEEPALAGMRDYFHLVRYMPGWAANHDEQALFRQRRAAVTIGNAWAMHAAMPQGGGLPDHLAIAPVPGGSYVGGTDLMIWSHSRSEEAAFLLVQFLSQPEVQQQLGLPEGLLPVRLSGLSGPDLAATPVQAVLADAVLSGRTFPCVAMIGMVEDKLSTALSLIQLRVLEDPHADVDALLQSFIIPLGKRMNRAFQ